jgi:Ni,Fe-hydrogenase III large subunit
VSETGLRPPLSDLAALDALRSAAAVELGTAADGVLEVRVDAPDLGRAAEAMALAGARLADLHGHPAGDGVGLRAVYALDRERAYVVLRCPVVGDDYAPLSDRSPSAFVEECEIFERFGVRPAGGKPLNRVLMPPHAEREFPLSGGRRAVEPREVRAPHFVQGEAFEFPFGPVRVAGWESLYTGLVTTGEEVLDLYLFHWHKHRGVERRLAGLDPDRALFLIERTEGLCAVGNGLAFCRAIEGAAGVEPPPGTASTRAVALELERLYNHAAAIAALCQTTGLSVGQSGAEIALERLLRVNLATFGHRYLFGVLRPGGVGREPARDALGAPFREACGELRRVIEALLSTNSHVDRLEATGLVPTEAARRLGLVGPVARASGCDLDSRRDHPYAPYDLHPVRVATGGEGDALARMRAFVDDIEESSRLIGLLLEDAAAGVVALEPAPGSGLGWAESVRGEALAWVELNAEGRVAWARLRPASVRNWRAFDDAARARNVFTDVPIIEASFWLTVAGFAR